MKTSNDKMVEYTAKDAEYETAEASVMRSWVRELLLERHEAKINRVCIKALAEDRNPEPEIKKLDAEFEERTGIKIKRPER